MAVSGYEDLRDHIGHHIEVVGYANPQTPEDVVNVSVECEDCSEVLLDYDEP